MSVSMRAAIIGSELGSSSVKTFISEVLMLNRRSFAGLLTAIAAAAVIPRIVWAQNTPVAKNVVLVHGLYADGSSWIDVIPYLQRAGLQVTAVQNPLTSLADDVAATRRVLTLRMARRFWLATLLRERSLAKRAMIRRFRHWCTSRLARQTRVRTSAHSPRNFRNHRRAQE